MNCHQRLKMWGIGSLLVWGLLGVAQAIDTPLAIGNAEPVTDILGRPFPGENMQSNTSCRVEVREVGSGIAAPDPVTGEGNESANPLFLVTYIGHDLIVHNSGKFSHTLANRLPQGNQYFARVYDAPAPGDAYYYANSVPFEDVLPEDFDTTPTMDVVFQGLNLVDPSRDDSDPDGDLLPTWMELEITSTDPNNWDGDGDKYPEGFEVLHEDYLENGVVDMNEIVLHDPGQPLPSSNEYYVSWWSIPNVAYRLEYRDVMVDGSVFTNIWDGTASQTNLEINVNEWVQTNVGIKGFFRYMIP